MMRLSRRQFTAFGLAATVATAVPVPAFALTGAQAQALVDRAVADINAIISSGGSEASAAWRRSCGAAATLLAFAAAPAFAAAFDLATVAFAFPFALLFATGATAESTLSVLPVSGLPV